jgi:hypothetical protein
VRQIRHPIKLFVEHDGGRAQSAIYPTLKERRIQRDGMRYRAVGDCAVRAVSIAFGISYDHAFDLLDAAQDGSVRGFERTIMGKVINGWRLSPVKEMTKSGRYICTECRGGHVVAYIDGVRYDLVPGASRIKEVWAVERGVNR